MKRFLLIFLLALTSLAPAFADTEDYSYSYYYKTTTGGMLRIHDQQTCNDPVVIRNLPSVLFPVLRFATLVDNQGNIVRQACVFGDPQTGMLVFIWLDTYATDSYNGADAYKNTDPATIPHKTYEGQIPYRPDYNGPYYRSI